MNQNIDIAIAEKVAVQRMAEEFFAERVGRSSPGAMLKILDKSGSDEEEPACNEVIQTD